MWGYVVMAAMVLIGTVTALCATEPEQSARAEAATRTETAFARVMHAAIGAFSEFLVRKDAWAALAFVVLFKFTDAFSGTMTAPFVIDLGFSRNDYAAIVKGVGLAATLIGGFAGGFVARRYSLAASLWIGGVLQAIANLSFSWLALVGVNQWALAFAITAENFTSAIGTVIFVAYLSALCRNPLHTATQYALLTALAAVGRTYLSSGAGYRREGDRLAAVLCDLRRGRGAEPDPAGLAAAARAFRGAGGEGLVRRFVVTRLDRVTQYSTQLRSNREAAAYWIARSSRAMTVGDRHSMLRHHAPFGDHGFAHLPGVLRAGDFVDLHRNFLADKTLQLRCLGVAAGDDLERLRPGLQAAKPVRRRQPARLAGELIGGDALALLAAAQRAWH